MPKEAEENTGFSHETPRDLLELFEVLEWQKAVRSRGSGEVIEE